MMKQFVPRKNLEEFETKINLIDFKKLREVVEASIKAFDMSIKNSKIEDKLFIDKSPKNTRQTFYVCKFT